MGRDIFHFSSNNQLPAFQIQIATVNEASPMDKSLAVTKTAVELEEYLSERSWSEAELNGITSDLFTRGQGCQSVLS